MEIVQGTPLPRSPSFLFIFFPICVCVIFSLPAPPLFLSFFPPVLGLHCCALAFSSCSKQGLLFNTGLLAVVASLVAELGLWGS